MDIGRHQRVGARRTDENRRVLPITFLILCLGWVAFVAWDRLRLEHACDGGDGRASCTLGDVFATGRIRVGIARNPKRAEQYYRKGCAANDLVSCESLVIKIGLSNDAVERAFGKAFTNRVYHNAEEECRRKETRSCLWLGDMYEVSDEDHAAAARLYRTACDQGSQAGCKKLADLQQRGE